MSNNWMAHFRYNIEADADELLLVRKAPMGRDYISTLAIKPVADGAIPRTDFTIPASTFNDAREIMQAIMDAGWQAGLRPSGFADVANQTKAMQAHIEDLRKVTEGTIAVLQSIVPTIPT